MVVLLKKSTRQFFWREEIGNRNRLVKFGGKISAVSTLSLFVFTVDRDEDDIDIIITIFI